MDDKEKNEELRPTKMRGVAFPKAKYGVIIAIIIIILVNLIYYKDEIIKFFTILILFIVQLVIDQSSLIVSINL